MTKTLDELNKLAAEKIMGWETKLDNSGRPYFWPEGVGFRSTQDWQPTRNIAQAWELLEKLNLNYSVGATGITYQCFIHKKDKTISVEFFAETAPEAIVRACLKSVGVEL